MSYTVNGQDFGNYAADARRFAMRTAIETGLLQEVRCDGTLVDAYVRGESGLAKLVYTYVPGQTIPGY